MPELPKETEQMISEFQQLQAQFQLIVVQGQQTQAQMDEIEEALEQLKSASGKIYKASGPLLMESNKDAVAKELKERKESLAVRHSMLGKQEEKLKTRLNELRSKIEAAAKGLGAA